jgi:transposase
MLDESANFNNKIYLYCGYTDMRKGITGLSLLAGEVISRGLSTGSLFVFRGKRADKIKILWWDGQGFCLYYKCLDRGKFTWPSTSSKGTVTITKAQLSMLKEGIDWRNPSWSCGPKYIA